MVSQPRRYEVIEVLGAGGFGTVYRARFLGAGGFVKEVALKVLNPEMEEVTEIAGRLRDEARVLGLLHHRAIVQVEGLLQIDGRWAVIMEYVEGADLAQLLRHGPVPQGVALEVVAEVAGALDAAYTQPGPDGKPLCLLHRDVKPSNIRLTSRGETKLLDFGIARAEFSAREARTRSLGFGTPEYMSPERLDFSGDTVQGDVYALGAVAFELLTGEKLGRGSANPERQRALLKSAEERLTAIQGIHPGLRSLVMETLAYSPSERPDMSALELRALGLVREVGGQPLRLWAATTVPATLADLKAKGPQPSSVPPGTVLMEGAGRSSGFLATGLAPEQESDAGTRFEVLPPAPTPPRARAPVSPLEPGATAVTPGGHARATEQEPSPAPSTTTRRLAPVAVGAIALLGLGVGGWRWAARAPDPAPEAPVISAQTVSPPTVDTSSASTPEKPAPPVAAAPTAPPVEPAAEPATPPPPPSGAVTTTPAAKEPTGSRARATRGPGTAAARTGKATSDRADPTTSTTTPEAPYVEVVGDMSVVLTAGGLQYALPGRAVAGTHPLYARVEGGMVRVGTLTLAPGEHATIHCDAQFGKCNRAQPGD